jgi:RNA polymerase sigma factor (sigma-70 family)
MRDTEHLASLHLLEMMQQRPVDQRVGLLADLLLLGHGFWQHPDATREETLRGFTIRVARRWLDQARMRGFRRSFIDPEDISHDLLVAFLTEAHTINTNPRTWFVGVAMRKVFGAFRREYHCARSMDDDPDGQRAVPEPMPKGSSPRLRQMRKSIRCLPAPARDVVYQYLRGLSAREIAIELNTTPDAVRQRLRRARQALRAEVVRRYYPETLVA